MASSRRASDVALVGLFITALLLPLLGIHLGSHGWDIASQRAENRATAPVPTIFTLEPGASLRDKLRAAAKFPGQFKYYFGDFFGFRSLLIRAHGAMMVQGLGVTSNPSVTLGDDGWLYLAGEGAVDDWRNIDPFTPAELESWYALFAKRERYCRERGIPYLLVIAPSKHDVYPEHMPPALTQLGHVSRLDQLVDYLHDRGASLRLLDLRKPLLDAKPLGVRLYQKTDTHWNDRGAWLAYRALIAEARRDLPGIEELAGAAVVPVTNLRPGMDLAGLLGLNDLFREESLDLRPTVELRLPHVNQNADPILTVAAMRSGQPRVVMFRDSFFTAVLPFIAQSFGRGVYIWEDGFDPAVIEAERPDIVIQELAQRKLMRDPATLEEIRPVRRVGGVWEAALPAPAASPPAAAAAVTAR